MFLSTISLLKFASSVDGFGKVFKHKFINNFCEVKENQGYECSPLVRELLLAECLYTNNEVDLNAFFPKIYQMASSLTEAETTYALTLLEENWCLSAESLLETIKTIS